jgi:hypothetical protein
MARVLSLRETISKRHEARRGAARASDEDSASQGSRVNVEGGVVLDAGAFIAAERRDRTMVALVGMFVAAKTPLVTSAGVVAQVWRGGGGRQVPVSYLLKRTDVVDLGRAVARYLGKMLAESRSRDVIDAHVVLLARQRGWPVLTSDPDDLRAIDPTLELERI